jgi:hypothetical protein
MNSKVIALLDTSIQIERMMGSMAQQDKLEVYLSLTPHRFVSTNYVFMEFQRSLLSDYVRVYNALLQHKDWDNTAHALRSSSLAYRPRALGRCLHILTKVMSASSLHLDHALELFQLQIQYELPSHFWRHVEPLTDAIGCNLVTAGVNLQTNQQFTIADRCRKEEATCYLPDFLAGHRSTLQTIVTYLAAHPQVMKDQIRLERLLHTVIDDPRAALGQTSCWPLGDVIIALQALPAAQIWTIDADFQPIAQALGLSLYVPAS